MGRAIGGRKLQFKNQIRYRLMSGESLLDLAEAAARQALEAASMGIEDIDIIVCAMATPLQAIPCNAALVHERIAKGLDIPAMDINTTCTSFLSAVDIFSSLVDNGRYERVLILSGDTASAALNPRQPESYELFSDGAAACVLVHADKGENSAVLYGRQKTWSEGAHDTEIRGGCGLMTAFCMNEENREEIRLVVPHQASRALEMIMPRLGFAEGTYIDRVAQYGNLVSASVPFVLCKAIEEEKVKRGDMILLMGTAAGLTVNLLLMRY